ncbi:MAG: PAS domain S-box protein [Deltaproteobacteria bacterium]|nr:PAS domain S-box protein [Deltaproteobacteria bacterium]
MNETERKKMVAALQESEDRYRDLIEHSRDLICTHDLEGNILSVNKGAAKALGYEPHQLIGFNIRNGLAPKYQDQFTDYLQQIRENGRADGFMAIKTPGGADLVWEYHNTLRTEGVPRPIVRGMAHDVTERLAMEKALKQSEGKYRQLVEIMNEGLGVVNSAGVLTYMNASLYRLLGYSPEELVGKSALFLFDPENKENFRQQMAARKKGETKPYEITFTRKDGKKVQAFMSPQILKDKDGRFLGSFALVTDITAIKKSEVEREKLQAQLRMAQKMEALGTLAGGIAHDFNNILAAIVGYLDLATENLLPGQSTLKGYLDQVSQAARRAVDLVKQILVFSRQKEQAARPFKLEPLIKETIKLLRASLPVTIEIRHDLQADFDLVLGDPVQIHQIVMNLCTNAAQAMEEKGGRLEINLRAHSCSAETTPLPHLLPPGEYLLLTVADTGIGIPPEVRERIFDPFFTTKAPGQGTGLGLAVVHGIVERMGGAITVSSEPGQGTSFSVFLPRVAGEKEAEDGRPPEKAALQSGSGRILFVDDEPVLVAAAQRLLALSGYRVTGFSRPLEALDYIRKAPEETDLVITDLTMPQLTGLDLIRKLREIAPDLPVILATGYLDPAIAEKAKALGVEAFLNKPVDRTCWTATIARALAGRRT